MINYGLEIFTVLEKFWHHHSLLGKKHKAKALGIMESLFSFGMLAGPLIGGILYNFGGFYLPFVVIGSTMIICSFVTIITFKTKLRSEAVKESTTEFRTLLKIPQVVVHLLLHINLKVC